MSDLSLSDLKGLNDAFAEDVTEVWDYERSVETRNSVGGTSRATVLLQISQIRELLK